ncbi:bifunctional (p)ppGpp synthetase/guanosine-3',5'-bis(diphosphate) 3'-pyrophosphohydrolase [Candidatus Cardinium hertigii]|uniref:GTP pyrophosphokinase n=1 Tax=Candidatus Cardinium hertigii TaxID=247481 RepID=A0A2Z3LFR8_9BACT|nr:bifunctional (p)ppGpp synthetase/guanosine-3',5'-bis(diphosphate) 3'-pyrophosphohydrolase [Candidatus Cardinium hertigii]AWN81425.1 GTP pyrophosphokinase [Candidatus Cardinium hertigii]
MDKNKTFLESGSLHQLATALTASSIAQKRIKATIQAACIWANFFEKRKDPFVNYPTIRSLQTSYQIAYIAVTEMLLELPAVIATILTPSFAAGWVSLEAIAEHFGEETASVLAAIDSLHSCIIQYNTIDQYAPYVEATAPPVTAALLDICDIIRLYYNAPAEEQQEKVLARTSKTFLFELKYFYIPLVHKIRLYDIQTKLADFWFKHTDTINYYAITAQLGKTKLERQRQLDFIVEEVSLIMRKYGIDCIIKKRVKSLYGIWHKMQKLNAPFNQIHDLTAIRIILLDSSNKTLAEEKIICWRVLSILSNLYKPLNTIMRDWISIPKDNGYESLHLSFETHYHGELEVQIRTERMDYIAEQGTATHWQYKYGK